MNSLNENIKNNDYILEVDGIKKYFPLETNLLGKPLRYLKAVDEIKKGFVKIISIPMNYSKKQNEYHAFLKTPPDSTSTKSTEKQQS